MENCISNYLKTLNSIVSEKQGKYYEFLLREGKSFIIQEIIKPKFKPKIKQCYSNSLIGNLLHNLEYWEGYYLTEIGIPLEHGFNVRDEKVVDFTSQEFKIKTTEWFGIKIPDEVISEYHQSEEKLYLTPLQFYWRNYQNAKSYEKI